MQTLDGVQNNIDKIAMLFPNCITERKDAKGKVSLAIDFDKLRQELSSEIVEGREERYQFTWPDKKKAVLLANSPINATLRPCREESVDFDNTQNLQQYFDRYMHSLGRLLWWKFNFACRVSVNQICRYSPFKGRF